MQIIVLVLSLLMVLSALLNYVLRTRHFLHMFQLNTYKTDEYAVWYKKELKGNLSSNFNLFIVVIALLFLIININIGNIGWLGLILILLIIVVNIQDSYELYKNMKSEKKPLASTGRMKRLMAVTFLTCAVIFVIIFAVVFKFSKFVNVLVAEAFLLNLLSLLAFCAVWLAAHITQPFENRINRRYFDEAQAIISSHKDLKVIGITGSYGKTGTKNILASLLKTKYTTLMTPESYNTPMGLSKTIRESLTASTEIFIAEMGARRTGDIAELCDLVNPAYGLITSIGPQHIETFKTIENVINTKFELGKHIEKVDGVMFVNLSDKRIKAYPLECKKVTYGYDDSADYMIQNISVSENGTSFEIKFNGAAYLFVTKLLGVHNAVNILASVAAANYFGVGFPQMQEAVSRLEPVPHRLQILPKTGNITYIDDAFNSNPVGAKSALNILSKFGGQKILVTPGFVEQGTMQEELNSKLGAQAAAACDHLILVGEEQTKAIKDGALTANYPEEKITVAADLKAALEEVRNKAGQQPQENFFVLLENDLPDNF